ncbi:ABC transporter permease [Altericista sp. CCNU0014]|uniref:ABC transporter permease n=1 Tax=Altericista sp. CCNU0014 TaxID=3082949 RepID=UPI003850B379
MQLQQIGEGSGRHRRRVSSWSIAVGLLAVLLSLPVLAVVVGVFSDAKPIWAHLQTTVLGTYVSNSLGLMLGVGLLTIVIGTGTAWLVTLCEFPGRWALEWLLLLPLAAPAYILAYVYTDLLDYYGPVQTTLRQWFQWESARDYWFPAVRSLPGAIAMLALVLYPYVYLLARSAFLSQSVSTLEASRSLGYGPWQSFWRVALPMARPAIAAGVSLALMETLNDFGTVEYFSVPTFTTGIYRTWFAMGERGAAMQMSALLLLFVVSLVVLERWARRQQRYYQSSNRYRPLPKYALRGVRGLLALLACTVPVCGGFLIPAGTLLQLMLAGGSSAADADADFPTAAAAGEDRFWSFASNSLLLAGLTALLAVAIAVILAYGQRLDPSKPNRIATQAAVLGYAIPGSVIAVGVMAPLGYFDNAVDAWMRSQFGISTGLLLSGTITALVFAYLVRFLAVSFGPVETSLGNISPNLDDASRSLGYRAAPTLRRIHLPLLRSGLFSAAILVFVDVMKELPATLIVRPFNFDTLAIRVYNLASDERLAEAAQPALAIVLVGLLPVLLLSWQMTRGRQSTVHPEL